MSRLIRRAANASIGRGYMTSGEKKKYDEAKHKAKLDRMYQSAEMPDPDAIQRSQRQKAAKRRGSRVSNILTEQETLG